MVDVALLLIAACKEVRSVLAVVWSGVRELAEHYHEQLGGFGLTMAPLEQA